MNLISNKTFEYSPKAGIDKVNINLNNNLRLYR